MSARLRRGLATLAAIVGIGVGAGLSFSIWMLLEQEREPVPDRRFPAWALGPGALGELIAPAPMREVPSLDVEPWEIVDDPITALVVDVEPTVGGVWYRLEYRWRRMEPVFAWTHASSVQPLLEPVGPGCPQPPLTLTSIGGTTPAERLICFGNRLLRIPGTPSDVAEVPAARMFLGVPPWLAGDPVVFLRHEGNGVLPIHLPPELGLENGGESVVVVGRFDDPRAQECRRQPVDAGWPNETVEEQVLSCRQRFVVRGFEEPAN